MRRRSRRPVGGRGGVRPTVRPSDIATPREDIADIEDERVVGGLRYLRDSVNEGATEASEQIAVFDWCATYEGHAPILGFAFHSPNGEKRHITTAKRLRSMGVKSGVPDIILPLSSHDREAKGLAIEMKVRANKPTAAQRAWLLTLQADGWKVAVCWSARRAIAELQLFAGLPKSARIA